MESDEEDVPVISLDEMLEDMTLDDGDAAPDGLFDGKYETEDPDL